MATAPRPRILPKITYAPPQNDPPQVQGQAGGQQGYTQDDLVAMGIAKPAGWEQTDPTARTTGMNAAGGASQAGVGYPQSPADWQAILDQNKTSITYPNQPSTAPVNAPILAGADKRGMQGGPQGGQNYGQAPTNTAGTVPQSALTNNRSNMAAAQAAGDTANIARLDAEWKRIAPLAQSRGITAERLVNSYMQPGNPAAKSDLNSALAAAISDDVWGAEATQAFGRPPNQLEWDEHFRAMNMGGRDPLEGHPQAVQNIQAAMQNMGQQNQTGQYDAYSQWLAGQK